MFITCWIFLCLFILFRLLCLEWPFCILVICGSFLLWTFLPVDVPERLACQCLPIRKSCIGVWWVDVDFFSLECNGVSSSEFSDRSMGLV